MYRPTISVHTRPIALVLLVLAGLAYGSGCEELSEEPDDTVRGAGSINVPVERLTSQPAEDPSRVPTPEAVRSHCAQDDSRIEAPQERPTNDATSERSNPDDR